MSVFRSDQRVEADGATLSIHEWRGSGPPQLHVHDEDDEAWHVLEGTLRFRLGEKDVDAGAGSTVFVPAGVPHTYEALPGSRYLIVLTPRLRRLIAELQEHRDPDAQAGIYEKHRSRLLS
ncbi:MAG TPA: cupin domain-containing protein [Candidatus Dormibacteraeota bacterium]